MLCPIFLAPAKISPEQDIKHNPRDEIMGEISTLTKPSLYFLMSREIPNPSNMRSKTI